MDEHYHWKLTALAHDAREMCLMKPEQVNDFSTVYPYICELTDKKKLRLPEIYWGGRVPNHCIDEFPRRTYPPAPKTLCEHAYKTVFHLNHHLDLQLDPFSDDPCEAWFTKVLPRVLGKEKAPPQPSRWKCIELDEEHLQALDATAQALAIVAGQLHKEAPASYSIVQNIQVCKEEKHLTFNSCGPFNTHQGDVVFNINQGDKDTQTANESGEAGPAAEESGETEPASGESGEAEPTVDTVSIKKARKWFRDRVEELKCEDYAGSLTDNALKMRFIRAVRRGELEGGKQDNGYWVFEVESLRRFIEKEVDKALTALDWDEPEETGKNEEEDRKKVM